MHKTLPDNPSEVFVVRFSPDGRLVATGCNDGAIRVSGFHRVGLLGLRALPARMKGAVLFPYLLWYALCCVTSAHVRGFPGVCACVASQVYNLRNGYVHNLNVGVHNMPTTALRFRPPSAASKTKNVLLAVSTLQGGPGSVRASMFLTIACVVCDCVDADGSAQHWHITSGKCLHTINDPDNQLFCVDYKNDGSLFATAGKDRTVRVYDEATKSLVTAMSGGSVRVLLLVPVAVCVCCLCLWQCRCGCPCVGVSLCLLHAHAYVFAICCAVAWMLCSPGVCLVSCTSIPNVTAGHNNRVFSMKFCPEDPNLLVSGGWDNTVQIWDLRAGHSVRSIFGPHVAGDSVDVAGQVVLTGSWRPEKCLQTWDLGTGELIETIPWHQSALKGEGCALYAAQFSKDPSNRLIAAGGSNGNMAKVFDREHDNAIVGTIAGLTRGVFSVDWHKDSLLAVAGGDCAVRLFRVEEDEEESKGEERTSVLMATPATSKKKRASEGKTDDEEGKGGEEESKSGGGGGHK